MENRVLGGHIISFSAQNTPFSRKRPALTSPAKRSAAPSPACTRSVRSPQRPIRLPRRPAWLLLRPVRFPLRPVQLPHRPARLLRRPAWLPRRPVRLPHRPVQLPHRPVQLPHRPARLLRRPAWLPHDPAPSSRRHDCHSPLPVPTSPQPVFASLRQPLLSSGRAAKETGTKKFGVFLEFS